jgi:predicted DNA-binding transcriptional regulator YafY
VRRDVERLRTLGYDVSATSGTAGGYRLEVGGEHMPPLLLDDDEATAVAVVLGVMASVAVPGVERGALKALTKLDRVLPPRLRGQLAALRVSTVAVLPAMEVVPAEQLVSFARACDRCERVRFRYRSFDGVETERRAEPHRLVATDRRWYAVAYDLDREDWRTFRVDRSWDVVLTGHTFEARTLDDPGRMVAEGVARVSHDVTAVVRVVAPFQEVAGRVQASVGVVSEEGGATVLRVWADSLGWLLGYLVNLGYEFELLEPLEWRRSLAALGVKVGTAHAR